MTLRVAFDDENKSYDIVIECGVLARAGSELELSGKVLVLTDDGVPQKYVKTVVDACTEPYVYTVPHGEKSKSLDSFGKICAFMLEKGFGRRDCVVAVGGGMVGDLAGFAAASYMRGVRFYNIPTTLLSQVDSSVGGKTAVNLGGVKNIVGAFYQPKKVLIDPDTLKTLTPRILAEGFAEVVKMAATDNAEFFSYLESCDISETHCMEYIIAEALKIKIEYVVNDEKESGARMALNFGHTVGHAIEALGGRYHGECVALGMMFMSEGEAKKRIENLLCRFGLPTTLDADADVLYSALTHDKKASDGKVSVVLVREIGKREIVKCPVEDMRAVIADGLSNMNSHRKED